MSILFEDYLQVLVALIIGEFSISILQLVFDLILLQYH